MNNVKKFIKNNVKIIISFLVGILITGTLVTVYATTYINAENVPFPSSSNLQKAIEDAYNKVKPTEFKKGDYVKMTPTVTSFDVPLLLKGSSGNKIYPSELNLWRVININDDKTVDMVSVYVSSTTVNFSGKTGYQNYIGTLNYIAKQYENRKYTSGSRYMGYSGVNQTEHITNTDYLDQTSAPQKYSTSSSNVTAAKEAKGLGDFGYTIDTDLVKAAFVNDGKLNANKVGTSTKTTYWIASRMYTYNGSSPYWYFSARIHSESNSDDVYDEPLVFFDVDTPTLWDASYAIRPIVTLKSGIRASSGSGTASSPYILD